jgi:hypothetical protein
MALEIVMRKTNTITPLRRAAERAGLFLSEHHGAYVLATGKGVVLYRGVTEIAAICWLLGSFRRSGMA